MLIERNWWTWPQHHWLLRSGKKLGSEVSELNWSFNILVLLTLADFKYLSKEWKWIPFYTSCEEHDVHFKYSPGYRWNLTLGIIIPGVLGDNLKNVVDKTKILSLILCKNTGRFNGSAHEDQCKENIVRFTRHPKPGSKTKYSWENEPRYDVVFKNHAIVAVRHARWTREESEKNGRYSERMLNKENSHLKAFLVLTILSKKCFLLPCVCSCITKLISFICELRVRTFHHRKLFISPDFACHLREKCWNVSHCESF